MDLASAVVRVVLTDANVIINLIHVRSLGLLGKLQGYEFVVPDEVVREVTDPSQREALQSAIDAGALRAITIDDVATLKLFAKLLAIMGSGEAACLSLAQTRGWLIASDEKKVFRREAISRLGAGRIMNTPGILLVAIRSGVLRVDEADRMKDELEHHRFRMSFLSFRDLL
jgi:predicted nucleic acid-binding protein